MESPLLDAGVLLADVLACPRHQLALEPERILTPAEVERYQALIEARCQRIPVAYLLGQKEFFGLDFQVGPGVLIPRPDSETLVELALEVLPGDGSGCLVLDVGTGSGCLAASLAHHRPGARVLATEVSPEALPHAHSNLGPSAQRAPQGVWLVQADLASCVRTGCLDLLVSNPPYVDPDTRSDLAPELDHEPQGALFAPNQGLDCIRRLLPQARLALGPGATMILEHGFDQGPATRAMAEAEGFHDCRTRQDLAGRDRCLMARTPEPSR